MKDRAQDDWFLLTHYWSRQVIVDMYNDLKERKYVWVFETDPSLKTEISEKKKQKELNEGMCNAFIIHWSKGGPKDRAPIFEKKGQLLPSVEEIEKGGYGLILQSNLSYHCEYIYSKTKERGISAEEFIDNWVDQLLERMRTLEGKRVWWMFHGGQPIASTWPQSFYSKKDAYHWFKDFILSGEWGINIAAAKTTITGEEKTNALEEMRSYPSSHEYIAKRGLNRDNCNLISFTMRCFMVHYCFEWGAKAVVVNDKSAVNIQLLVAFARGAARQYNGYWCYMDELAESWRCRDGRTLWSYLGFNRKGERMGGISPTTIMNRWTATYFAGAKIIIQQQSHFAFYKAFHDYRKTRKIELSPMGEEAKRFSDFVLRRHTDRGKPIVPVAIMLEYDHGWAPFLWNNIAPKVTWGCLPYEEADYMVDNLFETIFPGFRENPPLGPWNTLEEMDEAFRRGDDTRSYEHKWLTESPFGDSFDVVLENCPLEVLKSYPVVILVGGIRLTPELLEKLTGYVQEGGILLANAAQLALSEKQIEENFGVRFSGLRKAAVRSKCELCREDFEEGLYSYDLLEPKASAVQAVNEYGDPLIVEKESGKGRFILTSPHYLQTHDRENLLKIGKDLLSHLADGFLPVKVTGDPIEYLLNETDRGYIVTLLNHHQENWSGEISIKDSRGSRIKVLDWWKDQEVDLVPGKETAVSVCVPAYQFGVYEVLE